MVGRRSFDRENWSDGCRAKFYAGDERDDNGVGTTENEENIGRRPAGILIKC